MFNKICFLTIISFVSGCSVQEIQKNEDYGQLNNHFERENASFVQWNEDYAVTVKHAKFIRNSTYKSKTYDVQFFKKKSILVPTWTNPVKHEELSMTGFVLYKNSTETVKYGKDFGRAIAFNQDNYRIVNTKIVKGMSGGPVFNKTKQVVGINVGYTLRKQLIENKKLDISVYVPYSIIKEEWNKFEQEKNNINKLEIPLTKLN